MVEIQLLVAKIASLVLMAMIGYYLEKKNTFGPDGKTFISILLNRIALPFLVLVSYINVKIDASSIKNIIVIVIIALLVFSLNYIYTNLVAKRKKLPAKTASVFITGGCHANTAFLAFALLFAVYGSEGLFYATIYYLVDNILLTTNGLARLRRNHHEKTSLPPVTISLMIALPLMIFLSIFNLDFTNNFVYETMNDLANLTTPLAFIFVGMVIYGSNFKKILTNKLVINLIFFKMVIFPLLIIAILYFLNLDLSTIVIMVIIAQASMPALSALMSFAYEYQQDLEIATSMVVLSHFFAIVSIPLIFTLGLILFK